MHDFVTYDVDFNERPILALRSPLRYRLKASVKNLLLRKLHGVEAHRLERAESVVAIGVNELACFDFGRFRDEVLAFEKSLTVGPYEYKFAASCGKPALYASTYAVMLEGLLGVLGDRESGDCADWGAYINGFQCEDGLYYDPVLAGPSFEHVGIWNEGWGKKHLLGHVIIALARLGSLPKYPFRFLESFYDADRLVAWMDGFEFVRNCWTDSNYFMNLYTALQYSRDWMNDSRAGRSVQVMADWLLKKQNPDTGMWHAKPAGELSERGRFFATRAAYHFYPLFEYDKIEVPHREKIIDFILVQQNQFGAFDRADGCPGACEDIDAAEPLIRFSSETGYRIPEARAAIKRLLVWSSSSRCSDGGFSFYPCGSHSYGGHLQMTSRKGESSLFATWFRLLCLAYEMRFLGIENGFDIGCFPGYEIFG